MILPARRRALVPSLCLALLALGCTSKDNGASTVAPAAPPPGGAVNTILSGTVIACGTALPQVVVEVRNSAGALVATSTSTPSGRWRVDGLAEGTYRLEFKPPAPDPNDPTTELRSVLYGGVEVTAGENVVRPVFFAPVLEGGLLLETNGPFLSGLQFRTDPFDIASPVVPGLENLSISIPAGANIMFEGKTLANLGIDADPSTTMREILVEVAVIRPDQLPGPLLDANGDALTAQAFYAFYPTGFNFQKFTGAPNPLEIVLPNESGFAPSTLFEPRAFDYHQSAWVAAGVGATSAGAGTKFQQFGTTGMSELGVYALATSTPRTDVVGQITSAAAPVARAGITVVTNSGFFGVTDATGAYRIEGVPVPLNNVPLTCTAFTDRGLAFESASASAAPAYPETTIDIDIASIVLAAAPTLDLASSGPLSGATGVHPNDRIRLRFTREMDASTLAGAITITATPSGGTAVDVATSIVTQTLTGAGGARMTDAFVLPTADLPISASVSIAVSTAAQDVDGNALAGASSLSFQTGTSTLLLPDIYVVDPPEGPVETTVTVRGINLEFVSGLLFDGVSIGLSSQTADRITFVVPLAEGTEAPGPRAMQFLPGPIASSFTILPRIDAIQIDTDPDPGIETLATAARGQVGTSVLGVDQNDGDLIVITGQNLFDPIGMAPPVVTFGLGDGNPASGVDGDAVVDSIDESASANRIDIRVPPAAITGPVSVTVDFGGAAPVTASAGTFSVNLPVDSTAPVLDMPSLAPPPGAVGVPSTQIITATFDEPVAGNSRFLVGSGVPLRVLAGTTRVTTTPDGLQGIMEFFPAAGALPTSQTIFVQIASAAVKDIAGVPTAGLDFTFTTGVTAPTPPTTGPPPPSSRGGDLGEAVGSGEAVELAEGSTPSVERSAPAGGGSSAGSGPSEAELVRALGAHGAALAEPANGAAAAVPVANLTAPADVLAPGTLSVSDGTVEDWGDRPAGAHWDAAGPRAIYLAMQRADEVGEDAFLRVDVPGQGPETGRYAYRFELTSAPEPGTGEVARIAGLVTDLDRDARLELSLFPAGEALLGEGVLFREDLVQGGDGFLELRIPVRRASDAPRGRAFKFRFEAFDLREATIDVAPELSWLLVD